MYQTPLYQNRAPGRPRGVRRWKLFVVVALGLGCALGGASLGSGLSAGTPPSTTTERRQAATLSSVSTSSISRETIVESYLRDGAP